MKRIFIQTMSESCHLIIGDRIEYQDGTEYIKLYKGIELVGVFDIGCVAYVYISEQKAKE